MVWGYGLDLVGDETERSPISTRPRTNARPGPASKTSQTGSTRLPNPTRESRATVDVLRSMDTLRACARRESFLRQGQVIGVLLHKGGATRQCPHRPRRRVIHAQQHIQNAMGVPRRTPTPRQLSHHERSAQRHRTRAHHRVVGRTLRPPSVPLIGVGRPTHCDQI